MYQLPENIPAFSPKKFIHLNKQDQTSSFFLYLIESQHI